MKRTHAEIALRRVNSILDETSQGGIDWHHLVPTCMAAPGGNCICKELRIAFWMDGLSVEDVTAAERTQEEG